LNFFHNEFRVEGVVDLKSIVGEQSEGDTIGGVLIRDYLRYV